MFESTFSSEGDGVVLHSPGKVWMKAFLGTAAFGNLAGETASPPVESPAFRAQLDAPGELVAPTKV